MRTGVRCGARSAILLRQEQLRHGLDLGEPRPAFDDRAPGAAVSAWRAVTNTGTYVRFGRSIRIGSVAPGPS